ncbi:ABC-2 transporter permease [Dolosigranulum pigrum]|uniref:ABC-2 transporter permease n=2 Tax=Dolosigranulum pigrum TaxID=29394 RepID=UPI0015EBB0A7|nr:ABC-2 transporter permease [Dolosigranulum pigrum]
MTAIASVVALKFSGASLISILLPIGLSSMVNGVFVEETMTNWHEYLRSTPISTTKIVMSRYISMFCLIPFGYIIVNIMNISVYLLYEEHTLLVYMIVPFIGYVFSYFNLILSIPSYYKFGVGGSNAMSIVFLAFIMLLVYLIREIDIKYVNIIMRINPTIHALVFLTIVLGVFILSIVVSIKSFNFK